MALAGLNNQLLDVPEGLPSIFPYFETSFSSYFYALIAYRIKAMIGNEARETKGRSEGKREFFIFDEVVEKNGTAE